MTSTRNPCKVVAQATRSKYTVSKVIQTCAGILVLITTIVLGDLSQVTTAFRA